MTYQLTLGWLVLLNYMESRGRLNVLTKSLVHTPLQILTLAFVFSAESFSLTSVSNQYTYFAAFYGIVIGLFSWENEITSRLSTTYMSTSSKLAIISRLGIVAIESLSPVLFYLVLILLNPQMGSAIFGHFILIQASYCFLGIALGYTLGFRKEKSLNNMHHILKWVLALGSGLVMSNANRVADSILPVTLLRSSLVFELMKLGFIIGLGFVILLLFGKRRKLIFEL